MKVSRLETPSSGPCNHTLPREEGKISQLSNGQYRHQAKQGGEKNPRTSHCGARWRRETLRGVEGAAVVVSENCYMAPDEGSIKILFVGRLPDDSHRVTRKIDIGWDTAR